MHDIHVNRAEYVASLLDAIEKGRQAESQIATARSEYGASVFELANDLAYDTGPYEATLTINTDYGSVNIVCESYAALIQNAKTAAKLCALDASVWLEYAMGEGAVRLEFIPSPNESDDYRQKVFDGKVCSWKGPAFSGHLKVDVAACRLMEQLKRAVK